MKPEKSTIPFFRPDIGSEEIEAVSRVLRSLWLNTGKETELFETELRDLFSAHKVFCVNSGWAALYLSLKSFGIGRGDEVITTPYTFIATTNCILHCGAQPIFVDIDKHHLDPQYLEKKITKKTKAILAVDLGGYPAHYEKMLHIIKKKSHLFQPKNETQNHLQRPLLLADSAHAVGTQLLKNKKATKSFADIGCYSFHTAKNMTTGDGGAIAIFNKNLCKSKEKKIKFSDRMHQYILHGMTRSIYQREKSNNHRYNVHFAGHKFNMTDIDAALGRAQLKKLPSFLKKRNDLIFFYDQFLKKEKILTLSKPILPVSKNGEWNIFPHLYLVEINRNLNSCQKKWKIMQLCRKEGVVLAEHYTPITSLAIYKNAIAKNQKDFSEKSCAKKWPNTYKLWYRCFSLPFYQALNKKQAQKIIETVVRVTKKVFKEE